MMTLTGRSLLTAIAAACASLAAGAAAAEDLQITGLTGQTITLTAADVAALPHASLTVPIEGKTITYEGPPLSALLEKVGAPLGQALRGKALSDVVLVTAKDGYGVALALADADPKMRSDQIILADRADGNPLPDGVGPYRLVVEGDHRAARSERMVSAITVKALADAAPK